MHEDENEDERSDKRADRGPAMTAMNAAIGKSKRWVYVLETCLSSRSRTRILLQNT